MPTTWRANSMTAHCIPRQIEEGHIVFTGIPDGFDFPFDAAVPEAAGYEDAVSAFEGLCDVFGGHLFGIHIAQIHGDLLAMPPCTKAS